MKNNFLDFSDLLLKTNELLENNEIAEKYDNKF